MGDDKLKRTSKEQDVGMILANTLKPSLQCSQAAMKANLVLEQMARVVKYPDDLPFVRLC